MLKPGVHQVGTAFAAVEHLCSLPYAQVPRPLFVMTAWL